MGAHLRTSDPRVQPEPTLRSHAVATTGCPAIAPRAARSLCGAVRPRKATCVAKDCTGRKCSSRGRARTHRCPARTHPSFCPSRPLASHKMRRHPNERTSRPRLSFRYVPATGRTFRRTGLLSAFRSHARASRLLHRTPGLTSPSPALSSYEKEIRAFGSDQCRQALTS